MEINPNRFVEAAFPILGTSKSKGTGPAGPAASFDGADELNASLAAVPDVRAEAITRAQNLVAQASYPPPEVIKRIANLLAANLASGDI